MTSVIESKEDYLKDIHAQILRKEKSYEKICDFLEEGIYTTEDFQKRKIKLQKDLEELKEAYLLQDNELKQLRINNKKVVDLPQFQSLSSLYYSLTTARSKNEFLKMLLERVEYRKDHKNRKGDLLRSNFILDLYPKVLQVT